MNLPTLDRLARRLTSQQRGPAPKTDGCGGGAGVATMVLVGQAKPGRVIQADSLSESIPSPRGKAPAPRPPPSLFPDATDGRGLGVFAAQRTAP